MDAKIDIKGDEIKIYINNKPHLHIRDRLVGYQAYNKEDKWYCIEFYTKHKTIKVEYDSPEKWEIILKLIDTI